MPSNHPLPDLSDPQLLQLIREDKDYLGVVYKNTRDYCLRFMRSILRSGSVREEELQDIYHDAVIVLYEKIRAGNFRLTSGFQTYLNAVCRNLLLKRFEVVNETVNFHADDAEYLNGMQFDPQVKDELEELEIVENTRFLEIEKMLKLMKKAGGNCYELLSGFWYHRKSIRQLTEDIGFNSEDTTKTQKYKCQKRLQKMVFKALNSERNGNS